MDGFISVAEAATLPPGKGRTVHVNGREFALYNWDGEFYAVDDQCPHVGGSLGAGGCEKGEVYCPLHGWTFDLKTGSCRNNPSRPVKTYPTRVQDGWIQISI
jgi:nitrite reductase (NADH) small subunit